MNRREFLKVGGVMLLAGCTSEASGGSSPTPSPIPTESPTPTATPSDRQRIHQIVRGVFKEAGWPDLESTQIDADIDEEGVDPNDWGVLIEYRHPNAGNLDTDQTIIHDIAFQSMKSLFNSGIPMGYVTITAFVDVVDQYGRESEDILSTIALTRKTAEKMVWENLTYTKVPDFADSYSFATYLY